MSDFTRFVTNKLSGEWSAGNVSGVLTEVIIEVRPPAPQQACCFLPLVALASLACPRCAECASPFLPHRLPRCRPSQWGLLGSPLPERTHRLPGAAAAAGFEA
jgi:hypothetical protein